MSYSIRQNIPAPGQQSDQNSGFGVRRLSYFSKEIENRAIARNKQVLKEARKIHAQVEKAKNFLENDTKLLEKRQELINIGMNFATNLFDGIQFNVDNNIKPPSTLKFNLEEKAVEHTRELDNWCSKQKHSESDLYGYDYPVEVESMRLKSKELINESSVPLPRYYHITDGKIGGYYEEFDDGEIVETRPTIQYHRIDPIHIESKHIISMKNYSINMKLNHIAYLSYEYVKKVSGFKRYDLEIELSNMLLDYQNYQPVHFGGVNKHLIVYCHDRIKLMETYTKFKAYFFDINQLLWITDEVETYVKLCHYAHVKMKWDYLNNFFKQLFRQNFNRFKNRIILAQHPAQIPLEFRNKCDEMIFSFTDGDVSNLSKLDNFYRKGLKLITGNIYHISCTLDDFTTVALYYAMQRNIIK